MPKRPRLKRLSKPEFEGLLRAHSKLEAAIITLQRNNSAVTAAVVALLGDVDQFVCGLYNAAEASLKGQLGLPPIDVPEPGQAEIAPAEAPSSAEKAGG